MKSLKEIQILKGFKISKSSQRLCSMHRNKQKICFDVYLDSIGCNLQRDFVWNIFQKRELIKSILVGRNIPNLSIFENYNEKMYIIDGKQRLSTMLDFLDDKFSIILENKEYLFSELPGEYQSYIEQYNVMFDVVYEMRKDSISDEMLFEWFNFINFAGTPMDENYLNEIKEKFDKIKK